MYGANKTGLFNLLTTSDRIFRLTFTFFDIQPHDSCKHDYLEIVDGVKAGVKWCGTQPPGNDGVYYTEYNTVILHFQSDGSISHSGFHMHWETMPILEGCGGSSTSDEGVVAFPDKRNSMYKNNMNCVWTWPVPFGHILWFTFTFFDLQGSGFDSSCTTDYIELSSDIYNEKYCGSALPNSWRDIYSVTIGGTTDLTFKSDNSVTKRGFVMRWQRFPYKIGYGGTSSRKTGMIFCPHPYKQSYKPNTDSSYFELSTTPGDQIRLEFILFDLEDSKDCQNDYLEIQDGSNTGRWCGKDAPGLKGVYVSQHHIIWLILHSDDNALTVGLGFNLIWKPQKTLGRVETITSNEGMIAFPKAAGVIYSNNLDRIWKLYVPPGKIFKFKFIMFDIEQDGKCSKDYMEIEDGSTSVGKWCGNAPPGYMGEYFSLHNTVRIKFHSNGKIGRPGFKIDFKAQELIQGCGGSYTTEKGLLAFPDNIGTNYGNRMDCQWSLKTTFGKTWKFTFRLFDIEEHVRCWMDYVEIQDGKTSIGKWCGKNSPGINGVYYSDNNDVYLRFHSDSSISKAGFQMAWELVDALPGCGGNIAFDQGMIAFPNVPHTDSYNHSMVCLWKLSTAPGKIYWLKFPTFDLEQNDKCSNDYVEIKDGSMSVGKWCGKKAPEYFSKSNKVDVKFHSNAKVAHPGFDMSFRALTLVTGCGGRFFVDSGDEGYLAFPDNNQSSTYDNNLICVWLIGSRREFDRIQLAFTSFDIQDAPNCSADYLQVENPPKKKWCGNSAPGTNGVFITRSNTAFLLFQSDNSVRNTGFRLTFKTVSKMQA